MIPNGIRMAGTIPHRGGSVFTRAIWEPITESPWWNATGDTIDINAPTDNYGFTPDGVGNIISGVPGDVTYTLEFSGSGSFLGTNFFGGTGQLPMTFSCNFNITWGGGDQGPFSAQDSVLIGLSNDRGSTGNVSYICFSHEKAGINPPGENWQCICQYNPLMPNAASFSADSGVAPSASVPQTLQIKISADGQTFSWWIDGTMIATVTNDPTHIYFDPNGTPIVVQISNTSIFNGTLFQFFGPSPEVGNITITTP